MELLVLLVDYVQMVKLGLARVALELIIVLVQQKHVQVVLGVRVLVVHAHVK